MALGQPIIGQCLIAASLIKNSKQKMADWSHKLCASVTIDIAEELSLKKAEQVITNH